MTGLAQMEKYKKLYPKFKKDTEGFGNAQWANLLGLKEMYLRKPDQKWCVHAVRAHTGPSTHAHTHAPETAEAACPPLLTTTTDTAGITWSAVITTCTKTTCSGTAVVAVLLLLLSAVVLALHLEGPWERH